MKTNRYVIIIAIIIFFVVAIIIIAQLFRVDKKVLSKYEDYAEYITAFSSGYISKSSDIIVEFNSAIALNKSLTEQELKEVMIIEPKIEGTVFWKNENTLAFRPEKTFEYNKKYYVTVKLKKIILDDFKLYDFVFAVNIVPQTLSFEHYLVKTLSEKDYSLQTVTAYLKLNDKEDIENLQSSIKVLLNNNTIPYKIVSDHDFVYQIVIDSIKRTDKNQQLSIICDGSRLGINSTFKQKIEIPSINQFKLLEVFTKQYPEQNVILVFSDPIETRQDLGGLITLSPEKFLRFTIDRNIIYIYPTQLTVGNYNLQIFDGIYNTNKQKLELEKTLTFPILFYDIKPQVKFADEGYIIPTHSQGNLVPILTMNLKELDVRIIKIFENNVLQFLQTNNYNENYELKRVGKVEYIGTIALNVTDYDKNNWKRFNLDISKYIKAEPGAIYNISLGFRQHQTLYECNKNIKISQSKAENSFRSFDDDYYGHDYYNEDDYSDYWENIENPCHKAYYGSNRSVSKNVYVSDIALIAKQTPTKQLYVFATDVKTAEPLTGVEIEVLNFPKQIIDKAITDGEGKAIFNLKEEPYFVIAKRQNMKSFLKLTNELSLSIASFDVTGQIINNGLNGFIYGERGVWRPGDSLFFTFILQDSPNAFPAKQPIVFELYDPSRNLISKQIFAKNESNVYVFKTTTEPDALTGDYLLQVKIAKTTFSKTVKIETIKPNRLKISLTSNKDPITPFENTELQLHSEWLHGAIASELKAQVDVMLTPQKTSFKGYESYVFDDITKKYYSEQLSIYSGNLDNQGNAVITPKFELKEDAPGIMKAIFTTKVFERGGEFSIDQTSFTYCPYKTFVGIGLKEDDKNYNIFYTDKKHLVNLVVLNHKGKLEQSARNIEIKLYKLDWRWWWDQADEYFDLNYRGHSYIRLVTSDTVITSNGKAIWNFQVNKPEYGRFLLIAKDLESLHSTSRILYIDWSDWRNRITTEHEQTSTQLIFATDKEAYKVGEEVIISFPGASNGRALISVENSKGIISYSWIKTTSGINTYRIKTTVEMSPNVYVNITLLQPYNQSENDKPIRLYGIKNVSVENPESILIPEIQIPNEIRAERTCQVTISEKNGKEMYYTLAIVDEGLLSLTRFKTPNPWKHFYSKESYLFSQWDLYDYFIRGLTGKLTNIIGIGGDFYETALDAIEAQKARRFKPMVIFIGPQHLKPKGKNTHKLNIPNYMGEVRVMVIARHKNAYGSAEKQVKVIKPIVAVPSLPKVLSVDDQIYMPISLVAYDKTFQNATVNLNVKGPLKIEGKKQETISLSYQTEKTVFFTLKADKQAGMAKVEVIVKSGNEQTVQNIDIYVRNPNPFSTQSKDWIVESNKNLNIQLKPLGLEKTNYTTVEVSAIPPLNLEKHIDFLTTYPHGCIEQIVSAAFPQLYLNNLLDLSPQRKKEIEQNIKSVIQRIIKYQTYSGGFSYWPGNKDVEEWITNYTGHFLIEAQKAGYNVPASIMSKWKKYQKFAAEKWYDKGPSSQYIQAYRLYTLALLGDADINAMNRLTGEKQLSDMAAYPLAASYALTGRNQIANQLISKRLSTFTPNMFYDIFGSEMREKSFIALSYIAMNNKIQAFKYIKEISSMLSSNNWYSTHSIALALVACANYLQGERLRSPMIVEHTANNKPNQRYESMKYFYRFSLDDANVTNTVSIKNLSAFPVYVQSITKGILPAEAEKSFSNGIDLKFNYQTNTGLPVEWKTVKQTEDLVATIQVTNNTNKTLNRLALTYSIPSGWEILNDRLIETTSFTQSQYDYKDIRDDKVMFYFSLSPNQIKTFKIPVNASFAGRFYHPMVICEDMYNYNIRSQLKGEWVEVQKSF